MESASTVVSLVEKLSHRIPEIRDRSMKALCRKILSPLAPPELFNMVQRIDGSTQKMLQWINDRYDLAPAELLNDCLSAVSLMISFSDEIRALYINAGAVTFFEDFMNYNPTFRSRCDSIISKLKVKSEAAVVPEVQETRPSDFPHRG